MNMHVKDFYRTFALIAMLAAVLLTACSSSTEEGIEVHSVWMRPGTRGEDRAVYFVLHNHSSESDRLTGVSSDAAESAVLEDSALTADAVEIKKLDSIPVQSYAEIAFKPNGLRVRLLGLKQDFQLQDKIEIVLHFQNRSDLLVQVPVRDFPESDSGMDH